MAKVNISLDSPTSKSIRFDIHLEPLVDPNEIFVLFHSPHIRNNKEFYTDSNGLSMQKRVLNHRPDFNITAYRDLFNAQNYYPVTSAILIQDNLRRMTVSTQRTHGAASLVEGSVELMLHRMTSHFDGKGMGEPLRDINRDGKLITVDTTLYVQI
jgi:hypothetical protein